MSPTSETFETRPRPRRWLTALASVPLWAALACDDGGLGTEQPADASSANGCSLEFTTLASTSTASQLGFSADDLLARVEGNHTTPMVWAEGLADGPVRIEFSPSGTETQLEAIVRYQGGEVRYVRAESSSSGYALDIYEGCPDYLEVDVELELVTADGALDETLPAVLRSWDQRYGQIEVSLPLDALQGSFSMVTVEPSNAEIGDPSLTLGLSQLGVSGGIGGSVEISDDISVGFGMFPVAGWPSLERGCGYGEAAGGVEGAFGEFSAADVLARINAAVDTKLRWQGLPAVPFTLEAVHEGAPVCFRAIPEADGYPVGQLRSELQLAAVAGDYSMNGQFSVDVYAEPNPDGSLGDVRIDIYAPYASTVDLQTFIERYGIKGLDLSGFDQAGLTFSGTFTADGAAIGALTVLGVIQADCSNEPGAGCEGNDIREIAMAEWTNR